MKKNIILTGIMFLASVAVSAQDYYMVVDKSDGSKVEIPTSSISQVSFKQSGESTFQGAKRVFGNNLVKAFGREGYDRYEFTYDDKGFVTRVHRTKYGTSNTEYDTYITYNENITINSYKGETLQQSSVASVGNNGFVSSYSDGGAVVTPAYNSENQLASITYTESSKSEVNSFTYSGGNLIQSAWKGNIETTIAYTSPTQSEMANVAGVMEYDDAMGIDMDDFVVSYYCGMIGFGTKSLPLAWASSNSSVKNTWTLDSSGRATKVVVEKTSTDPYSGTPSVSSKTFFWEW